MGPGGQVSQNRQTLLDHTPGMGDTTVHAQMIQAWISLFPEAILSRVDCAGPQGEPKNIWGE